MNAPYCHNDDPAQQDTFSQSDFIQQISQVIKKCKPPKGIAINGYWGTGKTSALIQVYHKLSGSFPQQRPHNNNNSDIAPIWFEAWRYQHEAIPIIALLNEIREQIGVWDKFKQEAGKIASVTLLGSLNVFDEVIKAASGGLYKPELGKISAIGQQYEAQRHLNALPSQKIHQLLEGAIEQILGKDKRMVIFIDDLDRCTPDVALQLLEGIKIYLNLKNCVILFGMDQRQIERALSKALGLSDEQAGVGANQAREYLEKICQDIYHLPLPNQQHKAEYFTALLSELMAGDDLFTAPKEYLQQVLTKHDCLPANPRKIKALVNRVAMVLRDHLASNIEENTACYRHYSLLMAVTIIYCFHRRLHEQLEKNQAYCKEVITFATHDDPASLLQTPLYKPMTEILPSIAAGHDLPENPSDSNVFRLHTLFSELGDITTKEAALFYNRDAHT